MIIGYGKVGRSWNVDPRKWSTLGGDADVWRTLWYLATRHPEHTFLLCGRNTCETPQDVGLPPNVVNPWTERQPELRRRFNAIGVNHPDLSMDENRAACRVLFDMSSDLYLGCDQHIVWAGQMGTSSAPIRQVKRPDLFTKPHDSTCYYQSYMIYGLNAWRNEDPLGREEVWLCPDVRNYLKARDLRWPLRNSVISQYDQVRTTKYERFTDSRDYLESYGAIVKKVENGSVWVANTAYTYDALELTALPSPARIVMDTESERKPFGMVVNENRKEVSRNRLGVMKEWVLGNFPDAEIWGKWSPKSQEEMGRDIEVCPYDQLYDTVSRYRCTLTTPASGSGWATSKPWESFLTGTICFFHPYYDNQGWIIPTREQTPDLTDGPLKELARWLRPPTPDALRKAVNIVANDRDTWLYLADLQRRYVEATHAKMQVIEEIESRIGIT